MITVGFLLEKLTEHADLSGHVIRKGMAPALSKKLSEYNFTEQTIGKSIDNVTEAGEHVSFSSIMKFLPKPERDKEKEKLDWSAFLRDREDSKENCHNNYVCKECAIKFCSILGDIVPGVIISLMNGKISKPQANDILNKFKTTNSWGLDWTEKKIKSG